MLIAAILVATAIVGAVVLLNAVHSSPDVKAQTDAQSLADAERTVGEIQRDLRTVFFATNATDSGQYPFAKEDDLEENTDAYNEQLSNFSAREGVAVHSVRLTDQSVNGSFVSNDEIEHQPGSDYYISGAESLPYVAVTLTENTDVTIVVADPTSPDEQEITVESTEIRDKTNTVCDFGYDSGPVTVELTQVTGEISTQDGDFCEITLDEYDQYTVETTTSAGSAVSGSVAVSGGGDSISTGSGVTAETGIVNPVFEISYTDPSVTYDGNVTLFEGDDR